jgi:acetyl esterase/lipase
MLKTTSFFLFILLGFVFLPFIGMSQVTTKLYEGLTPGNNTAENKEKEVVTDAGRRALVNVSVPDLTFYQAEGVNKSNAAVIICPGGGYHRLSIFDGGEDVALAFAKAGINAFVLKYRTYSENSFHSFEPLPLMDLKRAFQMVMENASSMEIDTNKIGVIGFSAGGHLAAMSFTPINPIHFSFNILVYPVISFKDEYVSPKLQSRKILLGDQVSEDKKRAYSPELFIAENHPPSFLIHAMDDKTSLVENSLVYYQQLVAKKIPAQLLVYQSGGHGFALHNKVQDDFWMPSVIKWLQLNKIIPN